MGDSGAGRSNAGIHAEIERIMAETRRLDAGMDRQFRLAVTAYVLGMAMFSACVILLIAR